MHVPQMRTLILNSEAIITCGPSNLADMFTGGIGFLPGPDLLARGKSLIYVNFRGRVTCLPAEDCRSYVELRISIQEQCLSGTNHNIDDCLLNSEHDKEELRVNAWPTLLQTARSPFVRLRVSLRLVKSREFTSAPPFPSDDDYDYDSDTMTDMTNPLHDIRESTVR